MTFVHGDATDLPFEDERFDLVWSQNVLMNIADKEAAFKEMARVLRTGGTLAFQSVTRGSNPGKIHYPMPWASDPSMDFLVSGDHLRSLAARAGLVELAWSDAVPPPPSLPSEPPDGPAPLGPGLVIDLDWRAIAANRERNQKEGLTGFVMGAFRKGR